LLQQYDKIVKARPIEQQMLMYLAKVKKAIPNDLLSQKHKNKLMDPDFLEAPQEHTDEEKLK
jgi:hypothetical protein